MVSVRPAPAAGIRPAPVTGQAHSGPAHCGAAQRGPGHSGAAMFARYAYPPNELGYCRPADSGAVLHYAAEGEADRGLAALARGFDGAWPYLELISGVTGI